MSNGIEQQQQIAIKTKRRYFQAFQHIAFPLFRVCYVHGAGSLGLLALGVLFWPKLPLLFAAGCIWSLLFACVSITVGMARIPGVIILLGVHEIRWFRNMAVHKFRFGPFSRVDTHEYDGEPTLLHITAKGRSYAIGLIRSEELASQITYNEDTRMCENCDVWCDATQGIAPDEIEHLVRDGTITNRVVTLDRGSVKHSCMSRQVLAKYCSGRAILLATAFHLVLLIAISCTLLIGA